MARKKLQNPEPPAEGDPGVEQQPIANRIIGPQESGLKNYVTDAAVMEQVKKLLPVIRKTRDNREEVNSRWDRYRDIYALRRNVSYYEGRSQLFLGALRKAVDSTVRVAKDALFKGEYVDAIVDEDVSPLLKKNAVRFVHYLLEDQAKIKIVAPLYLRQLYTIGTSCLKLGWLKREKKVKYREADSDGNMRTKSRKIFDHYGPTLDVVDMKRIYVWPETAIDYDSLKLIFEDTKSTVGKLKRKAKFFDKEALQHVIERKTKSLTERINERGEAMREGITIEVDEEEVDITEAWALLKLPDQPDETWVMITVAEDDVLRVSENPWWFQHPPYLFGAIYRTHDYFYGHGLIEGGEMWQYMLNDTANQTMDMTTFTVNSIVAYDPEEIDDGDALKMQPWAKWPIKPDAVAMLRPPAQLGIEGMQMVRFLLNVIQDQSGATAIVQGAPREGMGAAAKTATGFQGLSQNAMGDILDHVEEQEQQVFTPLLRAVEIMAHENMDDPMVVRLLGADGITLTSRIVSPQDLVLSADLRWIASNRVKERTVQAQQLINFANIVAGIDPNMLAQSGVRVKIGKVIQLVASIGLDLPEADSLVEDVTMTLPDTSPELEQALMKAGRSVTANPMSPPEVTQFHLQSHFIELQTTDNPMYRQKLEEHIMSHFSGQQMMMQQQQGAGQPPMQPGRQAQGAGGIGDLFKGIMSQAGGSTGQENGAI